MTADGLASLLLERRRHLGRPLVMGIVNVTGDSFYAGSRAATADAAVAAAEAMAEAGADLIDVGGESTRPGSEPVPASEELRRVMPVLEKLAGRLDIPMSIDTSKAEVAEEAFEVGGASVLNDVLALRGPGMTAVAQKYPLVVLMHMLGDSPKTMQAAPNYRDVVSEVAAFLRERLAAAGNSGGAWIDPGLCFGKTVEHNLELLRNLEAFASIAPVLVGASRKSFLGGAGPQERLPGSLAAACRAAEAGAVCVRVHDVGETVRALDAWKAMRRGA